VTKDQSDAIGLIAFGLVMLVFNNFLAKDKVAEQKGRRWQSDDPRRRIIAYRVLAIFAGAFCLLLGLAQFMGFVHIIGP
jgi:hypothetical protein